MADYMVIYPVFLIRFEMKEDDNFDEMERAVDQYVVYVIFVVDVGWEREKNRGKLAELLEMERVSEGEEKKG